VIEHCWLLSWFKSPLLTISVVVVLLLLLMMKMMMSALLLLLSGRPC
jgi:hypothetical protein